MNREATPETIRKLRRDELVFLFQRGHLERIHLEAAKEIEEIFHAVSSAVFRAGMKYEPRDYDAPKRYSGSFPTESLCPSERRIYRHNYLPWANEMRGLLPAKRQVTRLQLVIDVVVDNRCVSHIERLYGLPRGKKAVTRHLKDALGRYAEIAGIEPQHLVDARAPKPGRPTNYKARISN